jgi:glycosyltransferase involved in cell wall biosynthesis
VSLCEKLSWRSASHIITTTKTARAFVKKSGGIGSHRISIIPNGVDKTDFLYKSAIKNKKDYVQVGYLGNLNSQDGGEYLIKAAKFMQQIGRNDVRFLVIGDGTELYRLRGLTQELNLGKSISFTGRMRRAEALQLLATCAICVQPDPKNPFNDSCLMVKTIEYMAIGKPVVAFDLKETRLNFENKLLYAKPNCYKSLALCILELVDDFQLRDKLGTQGKCFIQRTFMWQFSELSLLGVYETLQRNNRK